MKDSEAQSNTTDAFRKTHVLKTWPYYWDALATGAKTFEVRRGDRPYHVQGLDIERHRTTVPGMPAHRHDRNGTAMKDNTPVSNTTIARPHGYYLNSLKAWRADLYKQLRGEMARYNRMEGSFHPDRPDMGRLCDLTKEIIERLTREIEGVESSNG
jgi:hypothetical protein